MSPPTAMALSDAVLPFLEPRHVALAERAQAFARAEVTPRAAIRDDASARREARMLVGMLGAEGALRAAIPAAFGGEPDGPDIRAACIWREALGGASPLADAVFALQALGAAPIELGGSPEIQHKWLPQIADGRALAAFAMTEPAAGSDVAAMTTRATRDGSFYRIDGGKHLISNAGIADVYAVFAVTDAATGNRGISCFVVPARTVGVRFVHAQVMAEAHPLGEIAFDGCRIPASHRLGEEGEGFKLGMRSLDRLRPTVAAAACGFAARALAEALAWAREREQFGRPIAEFQLVQQKLARMAMELDAARLLTYRAARDVDTGGRATAAAAKAKLFATEAAQRAIDDAVQILGGRGVLVDSPVDRLYRAVRALRIYEGTSEIQHLLIARELLRD
jgi:acyl-CoA dehydrogenase